jgi:hypothetical protein
MNLEKFQGYVGKALGFAKPSRYAVLINIAKLHADGGPVAAYFRQLGIQDIRDAERLCLFCEAAMIPGRHLMTTETSINGPIYNAPYKSMYETLTLQFLVGRDMRERLFFDAWQNAVIDPVTHASGFYNDYTTTISIQQLDDLTLDATYLIPGLSKVREIENTAMKVGSTIIPWLPGQVGEKADQFFNKFLDRSMPPTYEIKLHEAYPVSVSPMALSYTTLDQYHRLQVTMSYRYWLKPQTQSVSSSLSFPTSDNP